MDDYEVKMDRELIAEDICDWFGIVFKQMLANKNIDQHLNKGILIGLVYALKSCRYLPTEQLDDLTWLLIYEIPLNKLETHDHYFFQ